MKKLFAFIMALLTTACSLLVLGGCASGNSGQLDPKNPVSITVWHYYNGPQKTAFDNAVTKFNETTGLEKGIIVEGFSQGGVNELANKVLDSANKKVGADPLPNIVASYADTAFTIDNLGVLATLDPYFTPEELGEYVDSYIEEGRFDAQGNLKMFPTAKSSEIFMMNKTDWDKFAIDTGADMADLATFEGLIGVAEDYYEWTDSKTPEPDDGKAFFGIDSMANYMILGCMQQGVEIFAVKNGKISLNVDKTAMRRLWDNFYVPFIKGYFGAYGRFRSDDAKTGDIISFISSTSGVAYFPQDVTLNDSESYAISPIALKLPLLEGANPYAVQQGANMCVISSDEKHERACVEFLKWFTDIDQNISFVIDSGYLPVKKEAYNINTIVEQTQKSGLSLSPDYLDTLKVVLTQFDEYSLYTNKPFKNGMVARDVLENKLIDKCKADVESIKELTDSGMSREDAIKSFNTDENFDAWFDGLREELMQTAGQE